MAESATLARPYAKAVFELARAEGKLAEWSEFMKALAACVRDPKVAAAIGHPAIGRGQLAEVFVQAMGTPSNEARNLLRLLADYNRLKLAPAIAEQFERLKAEAEARVDVEIVSATALDAALQQTLTAAIKKKLQREVRVEWKTDPDLIAGARIRAGDLVIDGSAAGELDRLRYALVN